MKLAPIVFVAVACTTSAPRRVRRDDPVPLIHEERCPGVVASWSGERTNGHDPYERLSLEVPGAAKPWSLDLEDIPSGNWSFHIFSPDCRRALLLQSRLGPYHVVSVSRLAAYAAGGAPDQELEADRDPRSSSGAGNYRYGGWISNTEVAFSWGDEPPAVTRVTLPEQ